MIELLKDALVFSFPRVHPEARLRVAFQRTLRIPDDGGTYPLPPGLGEFPLRHVDDFAERVPRAWIDHGGVMMPLYQAEAMWLLFQTGYIERQGSYPFAIKVAAGKVDAVTGKDWHDGLHRRPQDYMVSPEQPWLDGYCVEKGLIRQFVAMPLGAGYSAEEQITGRADVGGLQISVCPMKREVFDRRFPVREERARDRICCCEMAAPPAPQAMMDMGLAPGGRMKQEIHDDPFGLADWDQDHRSRCFVHLANSMVWRAVTGQAPPTVPPTAEEYTRHGLPWFDYYSETPALDGSATLKGLKSVAEMGKLKGDVPLPENESVDPANVVKLRAKLKEGQVREGAF